MAKIFKALSLGLLASGLIFSQARADIVTFARAGGWKAFGGTTTNGKPLCGVSAEGDGKWFGLKYFKGNKSFTVQLSNKRWDIKDGTKVSVSMYFDNETPWKATATGFHMSDGDSALEFDIDIPEMGTWINEFRAGHELILSYPNVNFTKWSLDLTGTNQIANEMQRCLKLMGN